MSYLFRHSRNLATNLAWISRSATTTSTPSGGTEVRSSGVSPNLSQASRSADGTDMAMKDAKQRANPKQAIEKKAESALNTYGQIALTVALLIGTYYLYKNYKGGANMTQTAQTYEKNEKQK